VIETIKHAHSQMTDYKIVRLLQMCCAVICPCPEACLNIAKPFSWLIQKLESVNATSVQRIIETTSINETSDVRYSARTSFELYPPANRLRRRVLNACA